MHPPVPSRPQVTRSLADYVCPRLACALLLTLLLDMFALSGRAGAATYYVDLAGTDGPTRTGSISQPWRTLAYAATRAVAVGDLIKVGVGTFAESTTAQLSPGVNVDGAGQTQTTITCIASPTDLITNWLITMGAWNADIPVAGNQTISNLTLDGKAHSVYQGIGAGARSGLTFHDLTFQNFSLNGLQISGSYTPFLTANTQWPNNPPPDSAYCTNIQILHCTFLNGAKVPGTPANWAYGDLGFTGVKDSVIRNCSFDERAYGGWGIKGMWFKNSNVNNCSLRVAPLEPARIDNFSIEIWYAYNSQLFDNWATGAFSIAMNTNVRIHHNEIICPPGETPSYAVEFGGYNSMVDHNWFDGVNGVDVWSGPYNDCTIAHNVFRKGTSAIFTRSADGALGAVSNFHVYNNTLDNCGTLYNAGPIGLNAQGANLLAGSLIKNNIVANTTVTQQAVRLGGLNCNSDTYASFVNGTVVTNNLFYNNTGGNFSQTASVVGTVSSPNTVANPLFKGGSNTVPSPYYALQTGSPALRAGVDVGLPYLGSAPDFGAFVQQIGQRIEAEMNYSTAVDTGAGAAVAVDNLNLDSDKCVRLPDNGDSIRIHFKVLTDGFYDVAARVRSGSWTVATNSDHNPTGMFSNYVCFIDGDSASFTGDVSRVSAPDSSGGGVYWGTMRAQNVFLTSGLHHVQISMSAAGGIADWLEVTKVAGSITNTWTGTTGNWSDTTKWDTNGVPTNDGTANLTFNDIASTYTATVNPLLLSPSTNDWSVNSLSFANTGVGSNQWNVIAGATNATLTLGGGGITQNENTSITLTLPIIAAASQAWNVNNQRSNDKQQGLDISGNLTLNDGVIVNKSRAGAVRGDLWFNSGTTTTNGSGAFSLSADTVGFLNANQVGRLGTNVLTVDNSTVNLRTSLDFRYDQNSNFANGINFAGWAGANNSGLTIAYSNGVTAAGTTLTLSGNLSGVIPGNYVNSAQMVIIASRANAYDERYSILITGDNSALTSTATAVDQAPFHMQKGIVVAQSTNALGASNVLKVIVGNNASIFSNALSGLQATCGNHVAGTIYVTKAANGTTANNRNAVVQLGLSGTGSVNFTGNVVLQNSNGAANTVASLKLTAPSCGQANFSGVIYDQYSDPDRVPVTVLGGGTVKLSGNNSYKGTTAIRGGTLLLGHNNAMGTATSAVSLGDTVVAPAGGAVVAATTTETFGGTYTWTNGVYTWTAGSLITLDGVTLVNGDRILVKDAAQDPQRNGVYVRTDATHWTRAMDLDSDTELVSGLRVHVIGGTTNANHDFYLPKGLVSGSVINTYGGTTGATFYFNPDADPNTDVAILTDAALTIIRAINVTNNLSTGKSILGGNSADSSTFSGTVELSKNVSVTAAAGGTVTFSGDIDGGNNVTKEGNGIVIFSTAKSYTGTTSVTAGTLEVDSTLASSAVSVGNGGSLQGTGTITNTLSVTGTGIVSPGLVAGSTLHAGAATISGHMAVKVDGSSNAELIGSGTLDLSGGTVDVSLGGSGFTQHYYVIAQGSSITGTLPSVTAGYALTNTGTQLRLGLANSLASWMSTNYPGLTGTAALSTSDPDHDGLTNLMEYALDSNPTISSQPPGVRAGNTLTFTKGAMAKADSNIAYSIEESNDLVNWTTPTGISPSGSVANNTNDIVYTFPSAPTRIFARLKVVQNP